MTSKGQPRSLGEMSNAIRFAVSNVSAAEVVIAQRSDGSLVLAPALLFTTHLSALSLLVVTTNVPVLGGEEARVMPVAAFPTKIEFDSAGTNTRAPVRTEKTPARLTRRSRRLGEFQCKGNMSIIASCPPSTLSWRSSLDADLSKS
jgi:hypothetical protein